jgi:peptidoglycan biosynthesis protein MviN/MurJ (putative lipid II flippase)
MLVALGSILLTITLNWFFTVRLKMGPPGLALSTSISALFNSTILLTMLGQSVGSLRKDTWKALAKIVLSAAVMGLCLFILQWSLGTLGLPKTFWGNFIRVILGVAIGTASYLLMAHLLKLEEVFETFQAVLRRMGIKRFV